jgi:hypothetical protein
MILDPPGIFIGLPVIQVELIFKMFFMKTLDHLPEEEKTNFTLCPQCGEYFDKRDVEQIFVHVHHENALMQIGEDLGMNMEDPEGDSSKEGPDLADYRNDETNPKINLN